MCRGLAVMTVGLLALGGASCAPPASAARAPEPLGGGVEVDPVVQDGGVSPKGRGLDREVVRQVIRRSSGGVRRCIAQFLEREEGQERLPPQDGRLRIVIQIEPDGRVSSAERSSDSKPAGAELEGCILASIRSWKFPAAAARTVVTYPIWIATR